MHVNGVPLSISPSLGLAGPTDARSLAPVLPDPSDASLPLADRQRAFAGILSRASSHSSKQTPEQEARDGAEQFAAITFLQPLLKQLRETNQAAPPFAPSAGEKQMQGMMDAQLAQHIAKAERWPLVDRVARDMLRNQPSKAP